MYQQKRALAIHDLSSYGRCSLAVILPVLSVLGVEAIAMPTAVLSTHTGGFTGIARRDLTNYMEEALLHYLAMGLSFDYIYTGYLGNHKQVDVCIRAVEQNPLATVLVDPVMGDKGAVYKAITPEIQQEMKLLVSKANIVTPNITEACLLLNKKYTGEHVTRRNLEDSAREISNLGPEWVIITGGIVNKDILLNLVYSKKQDKIFEVEAKHLPISYPGTGDVFASVVLGEIAKGFDVPLAVKKATAFLTKVITFSMNNKKETRDGVLLEPCLPLLFE